jgi:2-octaprenylphenol hydroxylase
VKMHADVAIVGGGMVGSALACALAPLGLKILVVESSAKESFDDQEYDLRVSAITSASKKLLLDIGAWPAMVNRRVFPYEHMHVWDATGSGEIHFDAAELGEPTLGYIVENRIIQAGLLDAAAKHTNISYMYNASPKLIDVYADRAVIQLRNGDEISARLVVGADGAASWVRQQMGVSTRGWSYGQKGIVATVTTTHSHQNTAWQRFMPSGPLAFLPLADKSCSIVWSVSDDKANALLQLDEVEFLDELNKALGDSPLGPVTGIGKRAAFPLRLQHALNYCKPRQVLVGDAAHSIHPLAGQGVNLGFLDVIELSDQIAQAVSARRDIGEYLLLRRYERARKGENLAMMALMDGFKRLFSNSVPPVVWLRNIGLNITDHSGPVKHAMVRRAMGLDRRTRATAGV